MIRVCTGDLLAQDAEALVNPVNTVGVMGRGLALQFKKAYPEMFEAYRRACQRGQVELGLMHVWWVGGSDRWCFNGRPAFVINFPTKGHWQEKSRLEDIEAGLRDLVEVLLEKEVGSVAIPALGCGEGGLDWQDVKPLIVNAFEGVDIDVRLFEPAVADV